MNRDEFWRLIESARPRNDDGKTHVAAIVKRLLRFDMQQAVAFERHRAFVTKELYGPPLREALEKLLRRPPDDGNLASFCDWLILLGQGAVDSVVERPELLLRLKPDVLPKIRASDLSQVGFDVLDGKELGAADRMRWSSALLQDFAGGGPLRPVVPRPDLRPPNRPFDRGPERP